jgi:hypothetical protein
VLQSQETPFLGEILECEDIDMDETVETSIELTQPIIVDLGKQKPRDLKELKQGEGKLWDEVLDVLDEVKDMVGEEASGKVFVPIVMIYRQKPKRRRLDRMLFPYMRR